MTIEDFVNAKGGFDDPIEECDELVLDGLKLRAFSPADTSFLTQFKSLETLSLNQCHLSALDGLPLLPKLETIELQDNRLQGATCIQILTRACPNLRVLLLAGNRFQSLEELTGLASFQHLEEIDLDMNPLTAKKDQHNTIRRAIFALVPGIQIVNSCDLQGNEVVTDEYSSESDEVAASTNDDADKLGEGKPLEQPVQSILAVFMGTKFDENEEEQDEEDYNPDSDDDDDDDDSAQDAEASDVDAEGDAKNNEVGVPGWPSDVMKEASVEAENRAERALVGAGSQAKRSAEELPDKAELKRLRKNAL